MAGVRLEDVFEPLIDLGALRALPAKERGI